MTRELFPGEQLQSFRDYGPQAAPRPLFLCFTNRSGSNLLADLLSSTGSFSLGGEFFLHPVIRETCETERITTFYDYCAHLQQKRSDGREVFVAKVGLANLLFLLQVGAIPEVFGRARYVWISRRDVLGQAISFSIADQTKQWTSGHRAEREAEFDGQDVLNRIVGICNGNSRFEELFATRGIEPYRLTYEDLCADPGATVRSLCRWLGVEEREPDPRKTRLSVQRDRRNDEFRRRFLEIYGA
ncbi:MAG: Stf0 family sulfotransferase [Proteobacteria bacterium]|nr:Stf0 family sulfotransferase [Pseudomonadota bacterium]